MINVQISFKKILWFLVFLFIANCLLLIQEVSAHVLDSSNTVGAVLHIDPGDHPIVSEQANIFLEFKDKNGKFKLNECDCEVAFIKEGKQINAQKILAIDGNSPTGHAAFVFNESGGWTLKVSGVDINEEQAYPPFELTYDIQVGEKKIEPEPVVRALETKPKTQWINEHKFYLAGLGLLLLFLIFSLFRKANK